MNSGLDLLPDARSFVQNFGSELAIVLVLFFLRAVGIDLFRKLRFAARLPGLLLHALAGQRTCLLYTDCDDSGRTSLGLKKAIGDGLPRTRVQVLKNAEEIVEWPVFPFVVESVVILITDVVPLSADPRIREKLQRKLERFVHAGGILVLGHDALYRRSKNPVLQKLAGCRITEFFRSGDGMVSYRLFSDEGSTHYQGPLVAGLEPSFQLEDREYVTGKWAADVKYVYVLESREPMTRTIPLVTYRHCGEGAVIWFNSGDSTESGPPEPLASPNPMFVQTLLSLLARSPRRRFDAAQDQKQQPR